MDDNLSLDAAVRSRYESMYSGVFYDRYIRGLWRVAEGVIYDMFGPANIYQSGSAPEWLHNAAERFVACDYGTTNPMRFLDIWDDGSTLWVEREYNWDSRKQQRQKTDREYADDLQEFIGAHDCAIIVDPSAASFITELRSRGLYVLAADNAVLDGIRKCASLIARRKIRVSSVCTALLAELESYRWDSKAALRGEEKPLKENDHSLDALRYMVNHLADWRVSIDGET